MMYSLATRNAFKRAIAPQASRAAAAFPRYSSTMHDNDPEVLETEKQRNLKKEQHKYSTPNKNAPGWNQHLASASEAAVKADKETGSPSELQEHTVNYVKARHHSTDSPTSKPESVPPTPRSAYEGEERPDAGEATYDRDKVEGPLKGSGAKESQERSTYKEKVRKGNPEGDLPGGL